jgi:hypothetical protein
MTDNSDETVNAHLVTKGQALVTKEVSFDVLVEHVEILSRSWRRHRMLARNQLERLALACAGATEM